MSRQWQVHVWTFTAWCFAMLIGLGASSLLLHGRELPTIVDTLITMAGLAVTFALGHAITNVIEDWLPLDEEAATDVSAPQGSEPAEPLP